MIIGAVKEKKKFENRVSISPDDVKNYVKAGHQVFIEKGAGSLSGFNDKSYKESGATLSTSKEVFKNSDIILKINCPTPDESKLIKNNYIYVQAGAGIVADSKPKNEFKETENKALAILTACANANNFK